MSGSFQRTLDHIRSIAGSEAEKGRLFERLMKTYFLEDPLYRERFSNVRLWSEWAAARPDFDGADTGIDLVAEERRGGRCAIQCKCYAPGTQISKPHLDSFIAASARDPFTARIVVDTGDGWGPNARRTIERLKPACAVLRFGDLASRPFDWPDLARAAPEDLAFRREPFRLRPHQQAAFDDVLAGFRDHDRGKLVMACGAGKTFTALRIAEAVAGAGGRVLYLVPSISLFSQSMREWATQRAIAHRYVGVCSDTRAGRNDEDASLQELEIPVTTDPPAISAALREAAEDAMTVVFCTYHSLGIVERAQNEGAPPFDLVLCDEAHRTTGVEQPGDRTSPFVLVHDGERIRAARRLYMTATPRLYTESAKAKAASHDADVFSMDDPETYGPELHRLPFSRAVDQGLLSDYKVVVLAMSEQHVDAALQAHLAGGESEINLTDAAKITGCWRALQNLENRGPGEAPVRPLFRAIAFTNTIAASKRLETHWDDVIAHAIDLLPEAERRSALRCATRHVDGQHHALDRKARIEWLKGERGAGGGAEGACRILSNARCLSEGIDVPALDAVLFMSPRSSHVDIVQAVGRAMRKAPGKEYGYIILPIAVPAGVNPAAALDDNERFGVVWNVLRALRSHDDRLDAEINRIDLNHTPTGRIIFSGDGASGDGDGVPAGPGLPPGQAGGGLFAPMDLPPGAIYARIVDKCGDRKYWETWARDVADIFTRLLHRIGNLLAAPGNEALREWFGAFHEELKVSINESIDRGNAIEIMAQHILTRPVFEALFEHYDFAAANPVARALDALRQDFGEFGLENEVRDLERFYESVRMRARGLDNSAARQRVLMELYEKFFATALKKDTERLGIVYTPVEIVDFILESADHVLREEFGRGLSDEGVHVLDPFTGTGIFLVRLLQSALIADRDLERKYRRELHANEIVLLAYYIAAVHVEEAFHGRRHDHPSGGIWERGRPARMDNQSDLRPVAGGTHRVRQDAPIPGGPVDSRLRGNDEGGRDAPCPPGRAGPRDPASPARDYEPFEGIVLTDTFNLHTDRTGFPRDWLPDNSERAERQQGLPIQVVVGNPPWSAAQRSSADDNPNVDYPELEQRVGETYAARSTATLKNSLYDTYKMAIRWASDRIGEQGVIAFVTNGSWIDGNVDSGIRACLVEEFSAIWVLNLRGNQRTQGERSRREGGKVFGQGSRAPVAITILVRNPDASHDGCRILYRDVGDYLKRDEKLAILREAGSVAGIEDWREITPNRQHDWIGQRSEEFQRLYPLGSKEVKAGRGGDAVFKLFSNGYKTGKDAYLYNYSYEACVENARLVTKDYLGAMRVAEEHPKYGVDEVASLHSSNVRWDRELKNNLRRRRVVTFSAAKVLKIQYRPYVKQYCYAEHLLVQHKGQMDAVFPNNGPENRAICVPGIGSTRPFSALMVDTMPDLYFIAFGQCFPRYRYEQPGDVQSQLPGMGGTSGPERIDNVTDPALRAFRVRYADGSIDKDDVFDYIYGVLHAPDWRGRFADDLVKELPRVPFAEDFCTFARAGRALAALHLGYETCEEYPLETVFTQPGEPQPKHFRIGARAMRFADDDRTVLRINEYVSLRGIPAEAHEYMVNGRTPLEWIIDRYRIVRDRQSGIFNDPNEWFEDPRDLAATVRRIVHVSVETARIVETLPDLLAKADRDSAQATFDLQTEAHRQALAVARSAQAEEDQEFVEAISVWDRP